MSGVHFSPRPTGNAKAFGSLLRTLGGRFCWLVLGWLLGSCGQKNKPPGAWDRAGYHVRGAVVYYLSDWTSSAIEVAGADSANFEMGIYGEGDHQFAKDRKHVYFRGKPVPEADPATFQVLNERYWRDSLRIYRNDRFICDDAPHFEEVSIHFVKNSHAVYDVTENPIAVVSENPQEFHRIEGDFGYSYCKDRSVVYINGNVIEGADPATFKVIQEAYSRDAKQGYYFDHPLPAGAEIEHLQILPGAYAKDRAQVYHLGKLIPDADAATFEVLDDKFQKAKDARRRYEYGKAVADPE